MQRRGMQRRGLLLQSFHIRRHLDNDLWNGHAQSAAFCEVSTDLNDVVGQFNYLCKSGQVGNIYLNPKFRGEMLEQQMLVYMMKDMQDAGAKHIWKMTLEEKHPPFFYSAPLWKFKYKPRSVHPSVTGGGYAMEIPKDLRSLILKKGIHVYDAS